MRCDPPDHRATAGAAPDFTRRAAPHTLPEWMDEPCSYEELRACLHDLAQVNRLTLAYRPTYRFVTSLTERPMPVPSSGQMERSQPAPLSILDVGSGGGDTLRALERWSRRSGVPLLLTGMDLNPNATRAAREFSSPGSNISWVTGDALSYSPAEPPDLVISSLLTHHLEDSSVVQFVRWMERTARRGWFINDLERSKTSFQMFRWLAWAARWHPFVRHDGPVSIRRSFSERDWLLFLREAGVPPERCRVEHHRPGRLCVSRLK
jgi:SAM-dependent methyltransferase